MPVMDHDAAGRRRLPNRRSHEVATVVHGGMTATVGIGVYAGDGDPASGAPAEVFIGVAKAGTALEALGHDAATVLSIALQYGAPLAVLRHSVSRDEGGRPGSLIGAVLDHMAGEPPCAN